MKILLIENDVTTGGAIAEALRLRGHDVSWVGGSGTPDITAAPFAPGDGESVTLDSEDFEVALIGSASLEISVSNAVLAEVLIKLHATICVGIDSAEGNERMHEFTVFSATNGDIDSILERVEHMLTSPYWFVPIKQGFPARRRLLRTDGYKTSMPSWPGLAAPPLGAVYKMHDVR